MSHSQLEIADRQANGRDIYDPIVVKIGGKSTYNDNQYSFEGIDGFWERKPELRQPVVGEVYEVYLATKEKTGQNAKPGSMYMDILQMRPSDREPTEVGPRGAQSKEGVVSSGIVRRDINFDPSYMLQNIAKSTADIAIAAAHVASADATTADPDDLDMARGAIRIAQEEVDKVKSYLMANWQPTNAEPPTTQPADDSDWGPADPEPTGDAADAAVDIAAANSGGSGEDGQSLPW